MALSNISGFPRIGRERELKFATEGYWRGERTAEELAATAKAIRVENWQLMLEAGIDLIPSNDFSHYDQVVRYQLPPPRARAGPRDQLLALLRQALRRARRGDAGAGHRHHAGPAGARQLPAALQARRRRP